MLVKKFQPEPLEPIGFECVQFVRAAHFVPELKKQSGDSAHSASRDADQMDCVPLACQKFRKIDILRHDCVYFSIVAATRFAASRGASCEDFSDIRCRCSGRSII